MGSKIISVQRDDRGSYMKIYKAENYDKLSERAASIIGAEVVSNPECVLGLATGSTPVGTYGYLKNGTMRGCWISPG